MIVLGVFDVHLKAVRSQKDSRQPPQTKLAKQVESTKIRPVNEASPLLGVQQD